MKSPGQIGYEAYWNFSSGKSLASGQPLPEWSDLPGIIKEAWEWSATVVREYHRIELGLHTLGGK